MVMVLLHEKVSIVMGKLSKKRWCRLNTSNVSVASFISLTRWTGCIMLATVLCLSSLPSLAEKIELAPHPPDHYTVVEGDTLWGIAERFLKNPWQWPSIWHNNPHIDNPDRIYPGDVLYPGDVIALTHTGDTPYLHLEKTSELRLSPRIRATPLESAIPTLSIKVISPFLTRPRVLSSDDYDYQPYVAGFLEEHIVGGPGDHIYVRSIPDNTRDSYVVFRRGIPYKEEETGAVLGFEGIYVADTRLEKTGDPSILLITHTESEVRIGDHLLPSLTEHIPVVFQPHAPKIALRGHIISVLGGVTQVSQYSVVAIDKGTNDGIEAGHVLEIAQKGALIRDTFKNSFGEIIATPDRKAGILMVFRPFDRVSYALVMSTMYPLHLSDIVQTPRLSQ